MERHGFVGVRSIIHNLTFVHSRQMELLERSTFLSDLRNHFHNIDSGTGHTVFVLGEAGIGKSSLVNAFLKSLDGESVNYVGACDSLFTPRPLGPLFDIAGQIGVRTVDRQCDLSAGRTRDSPNDLL